MKSNNSNNNSNYINSYNSHSNGNNNNNNNDEVCNNLLNQSTFKNIQQSIEIINSCRVFQLDPKNIELYNEKVSNVYKNYKCACATLQNLTYCSTSSCGCRKIGAGCSNKCKCKGNCNNSTRGNDKLFFKVFRNIVIRRTISSYISSPPSSITYNN